MRRQRYRTGTFLGAIALAGTLALGSSAALAQDTGRSRVSIVKGDVVQITGIDDWVIGINLPTDTINIFQYQWDGTCVHSTSGAFRVEVTSANGGPQLFIESASGDRMRYELWTYSRSAATNAFQLRGFNASPVVLTDRVGSTSPNCNGGVNLWFAPLVREAQFNAAPPGIYRDYATVYVTPE